MLMSRPIGPMVEHRLNFPRALSIPSRGRGQGAGGSSGRRGRLQKAAFDHRRCGAPAALGGRFQTTRRRPDTMASQPPANTLPMFYGDLEPLSSATHANYKSRPSDKAPFLTGAHAVPITI